MSKVKLCVDCANHRPAYGQFLFVKVRLKGMDRCAALPDLVDGTPGGLCEIQRQYQTADCGTSGKLFEPKEQRE